MELTLRKPHVEVDVEFRQRFLNRSKLGSVSSLPRTDDGLVVRHLGKVREFGEHLFAQVIDITSGVAIFWQLASQGPGQHGLTKDIHLGALVVDVELAFYLGACSAQDPRQRVTKSGPTRVADVEWTGGVSRYELEVDRLPRQGVASAKGLACINDGFGNVAQRTRIQGDVQKPWACDIDAVYALDLE